MKFYLTFEKKKSDVCIQEERKRERDKEREKEKGGELEWETERVTECEEVIRGCREKLKRDKDRKRYTEKRQRERISETDDWGS